MGERRGTKGLELWCRKMTEGYPGVKIDNMTTSWRNGLAFCAIIHHFRPDLIEFTKLNKDDIYHNNELAFRVAEHHLGIPALLEPEDMVEYTVPDRLSILTYLSQFYQAFAVPQGSSTARIAAKRPQTSPDHGIVSPASTSPPTKVAFTGAGKIRREPCAKCGLPVFIAERLNVGKTLYHRTCFRCARCNSQLTLANYYETENGEFCCEICPDEEKMSAMKTSPDKSVLFRSMSDEEKTASLKTFANEPDDYSSLFETALENIEDENLKNEFTLTREENPEFAKARSQFFQSQMEESSDSGTEEEPPDLPKTVPPKLDKSELKAGDDNTSLKDSLVKSARSDSGFPNKLDVTVNKDISKSSVINHSDSASLELEKTRNIVTKDESADVGDTSLVRARMRLFESNKLADSEVRKSDVHRNSQNTNKVPLSPVKSPTHHSDKIKNTSIPIVKLEDLENFDQLSKKDPEYNMKNKDNRVISEKSVTPLKEDTSPHSNYSILNKSIVEKSRTDKEENVTNVVKNVNKMESKPQDFTEIPKQGSVESQSPISKFAKIELDVSENPKQEKVESPPPISELEKIKQKLYQSSKQETKQSPPPISELGKIKQKLPESPKQEQSSTPISELNEIKQKLLESPKQEVLQSPPSPYKFEKTNQHISETPLQDIIQSSSSISEDTEKSVNISNNVSDKDNSIITILDSSEESKNNVINVEDSPIVNHLLQKNDSIVSPTMSIETSEDGGFETANVISPESVSKLEFKSAYDVIPSSQHKSPDTHISKEISKKDEKVVTDDEEYPEDLNPFGDEGETKKNETHKKVDVSLNPFGDDEDEEEEVSPRKPVPSPRMRKKLLPSHTDKNITGTPEHLSGVYIERVSVNPFESDDDDSSKTESKPPLPATRKKKVIAAPRISLNPFWSEEDEKEERQPVPKPRTSRSSLGVPEPKPREVGGLSLSTKINFGSNSSISSGSAYDSIRKKKPAPRPPIPFKSENYESPTSSLTSSPSHSVQHSPRLTPKYRKSKRAPPPPSSSSTPIPPQKDTENTTSDLSSTIISPIKINATDPNTKEIESHLTEEPQSLQSLENDTEQEKNFKDEMNRNRQSQNINLQSPTSSENSSSLSMPNKSTYGKWKRRKGQAPTRPIPQRRTIKCLPMTEIRRELEVIEIQQQGLEKQGVRLEQIIREKCEGSGLNTSTNADDSLPIDVEDLILQLFELVNEKNELFRKQAELMYLRRQQRLEEEHADVEYQIRCLMLQPEANKTDSDKAREEELINRLVEIVERRNEIIECLEMDRVREAEEDDSINNHINLFTLKRDGEKLEPEKSKSEKDKKKHKKEKKSKHKDKNKIDIDKDIDESETCTTLEKKKKKKFNIF